STCRKRCSPTTSCSPCGVCATSSWSSGRSGPRAEPAARVGPRTFAPRWTGGSSPSCGSSGATCESAVTFSIVAADPEAGEVGVAVQSKFLACAALVSWARGGVGAVATQAFAEVTYGPRGLDLLEQGLDPGQVIDRLVEADPQSQQRQVGIVDATGRSASFT